MSAGERDWKRQISSEREIITTYNIHNHLPHLVIEHLSRLLAEGLNERLLSRICATIADGADDIVHAIVSHSLEGDPGDLLEVILGTGSDVVVTEENLLRDTTAEGHTYPVEHLRRRKQVSIRGKILTNYLNIGVDKGDSCSP